jgi:hypothetical protein
MKTRIKLVRLIGLATPFLAALLLLGIELEQQARAVDPDLLEAYHAHAAATAEQMPLKLGNWAGREQVVAEAAYAVLNPNFVFSREYQNVETGEVVSFMIVHCRDARFLLGHYPPNCYVNAGWRLAERTPTRFNMGGATEDGITYHFQRDSMTSLARMKIANFMLLPDGRIVPDMEAVGRFTEDRFLRQYGAGQLQVIMPGHLSPTESRDLAERLIALHQPLIDAILNGVPHAQ